MYIEITVMIIFKSGLVKLIFYINLLFCFKNMVFVFSYYWLNQYKMYDNYVSFYIHYQK